MDLKSMIGDDRLALSSQHKQKLSRTMPSDIVLLRGKSPSKSYLIIKLALIDLSDKLNKKMPEKSGLLFGEVNQGESTEKYKNQIKKKVAEKIGKMEKLTDTFDIDKPNQIKSRTIKGVLREVVECMYPFTEKINSVEDKAEKQALEATYHYLRESLVAEVEKSGSFRNV